MNDQTRFSCAGKSRHRDPRGDSLQRSVEVIGMVTGDTEEFCKAVDTTDDELAAIAAGAGLHVVK